MKFNLQRSEEEILELIEESRGRKGQSAHTFEQGVLATISFLFFKSADNPMNFGKLNYAQAAEKARLEILANNHAQAKESGSEL